MDVHDVFFEEAFWVDGECQASARVIIPPEMEKATRDAQLERFGELVATFADEYRHP